MYKKLIPFIILLFLLCSCGNNAGEQSSSPTPSPSSGPEVVSLEIPGMNTVTPTAAPAAPVPTDLTVPDDIIANMAAPPAVDGVKVTDEMRKISVMNEGNTERIKSVMRRAANGDSITLGYLGGSITAGSNADPMASSCYAYLTTLWWMKTFPNAEIKYVNAGIGATDSYVGVHRVQQDLIYAAPDLVVVEFSVNDTKDINRETYDSLLCRLLKQDNAPAVVPLIMCTDNSSFANEHLPIIKHYDLPAISYYSLIFGGYVEWSAVGDPDNVHPLNPGHQLIAHILTSFYSSVLRSINDTPPAEYVCPEESYTAARFRNSRFLYNSDIEPTENDGFDKIPPEVLILHGNGWTTKKAGSISFEADCRTLGIAYIQYKTAPAGGCAVMDIYIDGSKVATLDPLKADIWGNRLEYENFVLEDTASHHTIKITPAEGNSGKVFSIIGLAVGF